MSSAFFLFSQIQATQWWKVFGEIECLSLIIACLCHDLDHRGTNNSFQIKWVCAQIELSSEIHLPKCDFQWDFCQSNHVQSFIAVGPTVFNINNGTSSFRSMSDDFKQSRKSNFSPFVVRRVQPGATSFRRCNSINGFGRLFPVNWDENEILPSKIGFHSQIHLFF